MPWNEPGNNDNKNNDPWGGKNNAGPPNLDKVLSDLLKKLREWFSFKKLPGQVEAKTGQGRHRYEAGAIFGVLVVLWALSGLFIVNPAEEAVILRFGKYTDTLQPGLHWMACFIDTKYVIDIQKIYSFSLQGDFLTKSADQNDLPNPYLPTPAANPGESLSDQSKNLVSVELNVQYRIHDARAYLFNVVNPDATVEQVAAGALSDVIGQMKLDDVLTTGREFLSSRVSEQTRQVLGAYNTGLEIVAVTLRKVQAPDQVRMAFTDVNRADQDKATYIQQAQAYASKVVPIAEGMAARTLADATGYQQQVVLTAQANVSRYQAILRAYINAPDVTRERLYLETLENVFTRTTKVLVDSSISNSMLYLPLDKLIKSNKAPATEVTP